MFLECKQTKKKIEMSNDFGAVINLDAICRVCLTEKGPFNNLFSATTCSIFKYCTSVDVTEEDNLPKLLCHGCTELLNKFYSFRNLAVKSNEFLIDKCQQLKNHESSFSNTDFLEDFDLEIPKEQPSIIAPDDSSSNDTREIKSTKLKTRKVVKPKKAKLECSKCCKVFRKYENLEAHMREHFGKKPDIKCELCSKTFNKNRNLVVHMRSHTNERKYQCLVCGKSFGYYHVLRNHELTHSNTRNHTCSVCDAKFIQASNLKSHLLTHTHTNNKFECAECGKTFGRLCNLKQHLLRHTGEKNYTCLICEKKFYLKNDLMKHLTIHSLDRPFTCEVCDKTFKRKSLLALHMRSHTGERPYACDFCPKAFIAHKNLSVHRKIHTGEKPHKCCLCEQAFIQKSSLTRHLKSHKRKIELDKGQFIEIQADDTISQIDFDSEWQMDSVE